MTMLAILKVITRNWWRNKVFFFISIISLAIGLACTNLLFTYFIHDYNIESGNLNKKRIFCLRQDNPMEEGNKVAYAAANIPVMLKEKYAEMEDFLRINSMALQYCKYGEDIHYNVTFISADTTLQHFFDYHAIAGNLGQVLKQPDKVAISEAFAHKLFGDRNPLGELLEVKTMTDTKNYEVAAVLKSRSQSLLRFDMITGNGTDFWGGMTFLKLTPNTEARSFADKINHDKVPTLIPNKTQYYIDPLSGIYFITPDSDAQQPLPYISQSNIQLLYISLAASLLVLTIACCNYTNMNLSRVLQQLKMIHVEQLMGSSLKDIRIRLFGDAFLTVLLAFGLSLLIINDCLSFFNRLFASHLSMSFFFSLQILPLLVLFVLIMSIVPAWYISYRLSRLSFSEYKTLYGGRKKQHFISLLVILQFSISIGLIFATFVANEQIDLIKKRAYCYEDRIEIGDFNAPPAAALKEELKKQVQGIESIALSHGSVLNSWIRQLSVRQTDGTENRSYLLMLYSDADLIETMGLKLLSGTAPQQLQKEYAYPALVNESYVRTLIPAGVNVIGRTLQEFDQSADSLYIVGGILEDFPLSSLENEITPAIIYMPPIEKMLSANYLQIKLKKGNKQETLREIAKIWEKMNEGNDFQYTDMHRVFMKRNDKVLSLSKLLFAYSLIGLLLTCFGLFGISWYATRQRIREISIRKIHGATSRQIVLLLNKTLCLQVMVAYILIIPIVYGLMYRWLEQFAYKASFTVIDFLSPLFIVWLISATIVCIQSYLLNKTNPIDCIKSE